MSRRCDNRSVGILIENKQRKILLIERKKYPFGFAPPAGHIDDFISPEACAREEVLEEVGLVVESLTLIYEGRKDNSCRREGGTHHYWWIYEAKVTGEIKPSEDEAKQVDWYTEQEVQELLQKTKRYKEQTVSEGEWEKSPGIELVWSKLFREVNMF